MEIQEKRNDYWVWRSLLHTRDSIRLLLQPQPVTTNVFSCDLSALTSAEGKLDCGGIYNLLRSQGEQVWHPILQKKLHPLACHYEQAPHKNRLFKWDLINKDPYPSFGSGTESVYHLWFHISNAPLLIR